MAQGDAVLKRGLWGIFRNSCQLFVKPVIIMAGNNMDKAFEILVQQNRQMMVTYASALLYGDLHLAEDVVQESFLLAHQRLNSFRMGENFAAWLRAIVRRKAMEAQRESGKTRVVTDSRVIEGIEQVFGVFDSSRLDEESYGERMRRWTRHCVDLLANHYKNAVLSVYQEGRSLQEAATAENIAFAAFAKRLSRARETVRKCIQKQSEVEA
jgi:RNA polymerase sigma-70 factor (ECF subfamily)